MNSSPHDGSNFRREEREGAGERVREREESAEERERERENSFF